MTLTNKQKQAVRDRAQGCCEYCRVEESDRFSTFHVDHIVSQKLGGTDDDSNLCLSCYKCNAYKGSHVAAIDPDTEDATKLYHPRLQVWDDHFRINEDATLTGLTPEGRATVIVLRMNDTQRVRQRQILILADEYPCTPN